MEETYLKKNKENKTRKTKQGVPQKLQIAEKEWKISEIEHCP